MGDKVKARNSPLRFSFSPESKGSFSVAAAAQPGLAKSNRMIGGESMLIDRAAITNFVCTREGRFRVRRVGGLALFLCGAILLAFELFGWLR